MAAAAGVSRWGALPARAADVGSLSSSSTPPPAQVAVVAYVPRKHKEGARAPPGPDGRTQKQRMLAGAGARAALPCALPCIVCVCSWLTPYTHSTLNPSQTPCLTAGESYDPFDPELVDTRIAARRRAGRGRGGRRRCCSVPHRRRPAARQAWRSVSRSAPACPSQTAARPAGDPAGADQPALLLPGCLMRREPALLWWCRLLRQLNHELDYADTEASPPATPL